MHSRTVHHHSKICSILLKFFYSDIGVLICFSNDPINGPHRIIPVNIFQWLHELRIVRPENVLLSLYGLVLILIFSVSKSIGRAHDYWLIVWEILAFLRRGTPWTGRQSITGPHRDKRDKQPHTLTLTPKEAGVKMIMITSKAIKRIIMNISALNLFLWYDQ